MHTSTQLNTADAVQHSKIAIETGTSARHNSHVDRPLTFCDTHRAPIDIYNFKYLLVAA